MEIIIRDNYEQLSKRAAEFVKQRVLEKPDLTICLASGNTPIGMYRELIKMNLDFSKATFFNLDEYIPMSPSNTQSYNYYIRNNLLNHINVNKDNVFIMDGSTKDPEQYCKWYENKIKEKGGIDLQILGIGRNGHIGFNEPGSKIDSLTRVVSLDKETIKDNKISKTKAMTMGIKTILQAKECLLLASGKHKKEILNQALKGPITSKIPASYLQKHKRLFVIIDKEVSG